MVWQAQAGEIAMFTRITFALAFALGTASGAVAATKSQSIVPSQNVYNPAGAYVGTDPDLNIRFELNRDWDRGHWISRNPDKAKPAFGPAGSNSASALRRDCFVLRGYYLRSQFSGYGRRHKCECQRTLPILERTNGGSSLAPLLKQITPAVVSIAIEVARTGERILR
jgi:hypothetical protein